MPRYIATRDTWLSHECRLVKAGDEFETTFPEATVDGKRQPMRMGENLKPVTDSAEVRKPRGKSAAEDDLV